MLICETGDADVIAMASKYIEVPGTTDCLQGILTIIPMQLMSLHVAELRKLDVSLQIRLGWD